MVVSYLKLRSNFTAEYSGWCMYIGYAQLTQPEREREEVAFNRA